MLCRFLIPACLKGEIIHTTFRYIIEDQLPGNDIGIPDYTVMKRQFHPAF